MPRRVNFWIVGRNIVTNTVETERLLLRSFKDEDAALLEQWLYASHVAPWYENPEDWLNEVRERHDDFAFLTHFIAEVDGNPVGFCQYYDCFDAIELEDWGIPISVPREVYSIDYLIGEAEYLQRGFGEEMIRQMLEVLCGLGAKKVIVQPEKSNEKSNRSLLANGFLWRGSYLVKPL